MALIVVERQRRIFRRHLHVLRLLRTRRHGLLVVGGNLLRRLLRRRASGTAIVAHVGGVVDDGADRHVGAVVDGAVVTERDSTPKAALVAFAGIAEAIGYAAVEADFWAPIAFVKRIDAVVPAPVSRRPQQRR